MRKTILVALSAIFSLPLIAQRDTIDLNYECSSVVTSK